MLTLCLLLLTSAAPVKCALPMLMMRTEAQPRTPAFNAAAQRFDHATTNWKYALQNAVMAFEASGKLDEARAALESAARNDTAHAEATRAAAAALISRVGCL